jgi:hypothetical protein
MALACERSKDGRCAMEQRRMQSMRRPQPRVKNRRHPKPSEIPITPWPVPMIGLAYYYPRMRKHWASHSRHRLTLFDDGIANADMIETGSTERYAAKG